jgi:quercetin dioxygenase-like cupin family protein
MESWDIRSLDLEPHHPQVLRSDEESRAIAIRLPPGEVLQEHQVHERAYLLVVEGEIEIANSDGEMTVGTGSLSHFGPNERRTVRALGSGTHRGSPPHAPAASGSGLARAGYRGLSTSARLRGGRRLGVRGLRGDLGPLL